MTASAEVELPALTVTPGEEATTTLTVRNETDIVEAYTLEVVGECAGWATVEPARVSLYPGTSETVTARLRPPRSPETRAGEFPLGVRVLPAERPELARVHETTVTVAAFHEHRAGLAPGRRRGWRRARYRVSARNLGNADAEIALTARQPGEDLRVGFTPASLPLTPNESGDATLRARARKLRWFGKPARWPFEVDTSRRADGEDAEKEKPLAAQQPLAAEFVQLPILPTWLLTLLAAILALLLAWFTLVRPAVRSSARQAAADAVSEKAAALSPAGRSGESGGGAANGQRQQGGGQQGNPGQTGGAGNTVPGSGVAAPGTAQRDLMTIDVRTGNSGLRVEAYKVPAGKVLDLTDIVASNFQGDEGLLTVRAGGQPIMTIALETFRNQDYHWVTPIQIPANQSVTARVTCAKPGTPASGKQASECHELLNLSGELSDLKR